MDFAKQKVKRNVKMFSTVNSWHTKYESWKMEFSNDLSFVRRFKRFMKMNLCCQNILFRRDFWATIDKYQDSIPKLPTNDQGDYGKTIINTKHIPVSKFRDSCHDKFRISLPVEHCQCVNVCVCVVYVYDILYFH